MGAEVNKAKTAFIAMAEEQGNPEVAAAMEEQMPGVSAQSGEQFHQQLGDEVFGGTETLITPDDYRQINPSTQPAWQRMQGAQGYGLNLMGQRMSDIESARNQMNTYLRRDLANSRRPGIIRAIAAKDAASGMSAQQAAINVPRGESEATGLQAEQASFSDPGAASRALGVSSRLPQNLSSFDPMGYLQGPAGARTYGADAGMNTFFQNTAGLQGLVQGATGSLEAQQEEALRAAEADAMDRVTSEFANMGALYSPAAAEAAARAVGDIRVGAASDLAQQRANMLGSLYGQGLGVAQQGVATAGQQALERASQANQYGLGAAGLGVRASGQDAQNQLALGELANQFGLQRAGMADDYGLNRSQMLNQRNLQNAQMQNQMAAQRAGMMDEYGLGRAEALNQARLQNAQMANQFGLEQAGLSNQFSLNRAGMMDENQRFYQQQQQAALQNAANQQAQMAGLYGNLYGQGADIYGQGLAGIRQYGDPTFVAPQVAQNPGLLSQLFGAIPSMV